ncbi:hypothetical protein ANCCEY_03346 [Ancylostoma ceylanicum]|uniref:Anoctamin n=1 Tax=Ancylostoma ceylanicum TaxID=53326 RepID=A0A0D6M279_9BILA|nr:hypothetical protein ANCCEY_03346 [Ancylostoma ceylanicum]
MISPGLLQHECSTNSVILRVQKRREASAAIREDKMPLWANSRRLSSIINSTIKLKMPLWANSRRLSSIINSTIKLKSNIGSVQGQLTLAQGWTGMRQIWCLFLSVHKVSFGNHIMTFNRVSKLKSQDDVDLPKYPEMGDAGEVVILPSDVPMDDVLEKTYSHQPKELQDFFSLEWDKNCYFSDGKRQIDYVLAYEEDNNNEATSASPSSVEMDPDDDDKNSPQSASSSKEKKQNRRFYFETNLQKMGLQIERVNISPQLGRTRFVLLHAPFPVLEKQAQLLTVKLPVQQSDVTFQDRTSLPGLVDSILSRVGIFDFDERVKKVLEEPDFFTAPYSSDRRKQFVNWDRPDILFPHSERSRMVYDLLTRAHYDDPHSDVKGKNQYRFGIERLVAQGVYSAAYPLHQTIRDGYERKKGSEVSQRELLYNHWVSWRNVLKYQPLDCIKRYFGTKIAFYFAWLGYYTRSLYLAAFVGIITVLFGFWNVGEDVVSNDICGRDGVGSKTLICPQCENYCDFTPLNNSCVYAKVSYLFDNGSTVIFAALMSIWATLFLEGWKRYHAEIAWKWGLLDFVIEEDTVRPEFQYRVKTKRFNPVTQQDEPYLSGKKKAANFFAAMVTVMDNPTVDSYAFLIVSATAAFINLAIIITMNYFYNSLAHRLTRWECPRTQADFDNSYTFKLPGHKDNDGNVKIAGYRNVMSLLRKWQLMVPIVETKQQRKERIREESCKKVGKDMARWEADYYLNPTYDQFLFDEYLEMVLQFGFCTLFVAAFPLAPFFAVLNNILEIRLDAYKFLVNTQRPVPAQALVIAFTSDFVPKTMYWFAKHSMIGYVDSSLSYFDASEFNMKSSQFHNVTECRYRGWRRSPCSLMDTTNTTYGKESCDDFLGLSMEWWKHVVFVIKIVVEYLIPDVPTRIFVQQQREKYLVRKALLNDLASGRETANGPSPERKA